MGAGEEEEAMVREKEMGLARLKRERRRDMHVEEISSRGREGRGIELGRRKFTYFNLGLSEYSAEEDLAFEGLERWHGDRYRSKKRRERERQRKNETRRFRHLRNE